MGALTEELRQFLDSSPVGVFAAPAEDVRPRQSLVYFIRDGDRLLIADRPAPKGNARDGVGGCPGPRRDVKARRRTGRSVSARGHERPPRSACGRRASPGKRYRRRSRLSGHGQGAEASAGGGPPLFR
jgi:hypothetical protein